MSLMHKNIGWPANTPSILRDVKLIAPTSSQDFFINTSEQVRELLNRITMIPLQDQAALFIDLEGRVPGRGGTVSILQIFVEPLNEVYLLDINALQAAAFITGSNNNVSLKTIFENGEILKAFFDVRNDSDALYAHYDIKLQGVIDVQLMHNVLHPKNMQLKGLGGCVDQFAAAYSQGTKSTNKYKPIDKDLFTALQAAVLAKFKEDGQAIFRADSIIGASFDKRPLKKELLLYSIHDVVMMPKLYKDYAKAMTPNQMSNVLKGSKHRVALSFRDDFNSPGRDENWGPWANKNNDPIKIFWDFSEEERLDGLDTTPWGKKQEKNRMDYEFKHRIPTGTTPEHWRDEEVEIADTGRWMDPSVDSDLGWSS